MDNYSTSSAGRVTPNSSSPTSPVDQNPPAPQSLSSHTTSKAPSSTPPHLLRNIVLVVISLIIIIGISVLALLYFDEQANRRLDAESVHLKSDLRIEFGSEAKVSDFLESLNGSLVNDHTVNTDTLGETEVTFEYINSKNRRRKISFTIDVADLVEPTIYGLNAYTVYRNYTGDLTDLMLSGDDLDDTPNREIFGDYDLSTPGAYSLEYIVTDASGNVATHPFTLNVVNLPADNNGETYTPDTSEPLKLSDVIKLHKSDHTKIGIDVSQWQGDIEWSKVKSAGVEFAFIRIGYQVGFNGELILDPYFEQNIRAAEGIGLPVGVYFYSYANSIGQAIEQANWIATKLQNYTVELGVTFDWENWGDFNSAGMSFRTIRKVAETFLNRLDEHGYRGNLYSSKNYLEKIWQPNLWLPDRYDIWLAQYYDRVTYEGDYWIWQMSDSGEVPGIYGAVDLDIMYLN